MATINQSDNFRLPGDCVNFVLPNKCNEWIIDKFEEKGFKGKIDYVATSDLQKAEQMST